MTHVIVTLRKQQAEAGKLDAANLPVRRSGREGGKELEYGG
ncbi:MAG: hypothetical protein SGJ26_05315 [Nitrospirota bacterium]|nr:hypothetical protein [Nitrospirota bacterium]